MNKNAISVKGNFSWGFSEKKAASKKKPEKKDKKKAEEAKEETPAEVEKAVEGTSDFKSFLNAFVTEKIVKAKGEGMTAEEFKVFFEDAIKIK